jgi:peptidoglycan/xylan/chitin deacetylase (PgdA/CDA1 family)
MTRLAHACVVVILALLIGITTVLSADPARLVSRGPTTNQTIALTFDDGSSPERCQRIYDTLVQFDIPATWFPNAVYMASAPSLWRRIARRFPIANHTTHHRSLATASRKQIREEITSHERRVKAITGVPVSKLLRPPYGAWDAQVLREAGRLGYSHVVLWDVSSADTSPRGTDRGVTQAARNDSHSARLRPMKIRFSVQAKWPVVRCYTGGPVRSCKKGWSACLCKAFALQKTLK